jgi:hypothetical protein
MTIYCLIEKYYGDCDLETIIGYDLLKSNLEIAAKQCLWENYNREQEIIKKHYYHRFYENKEAVPYNGEDLEFILQEEKYWDESKLNGKYKQWETCLYGNWWTYYPKFNYIIKEINIDEQ